MSSQKRAEYARLLKAPVDLDILVAQGVLKKVGAQYELLDKARLPKHAETQVTSVTRETKTDKAGQKTERTLLKFRKLRS